MIKKILFWTFGVLLVLAAAGYLYYKLVIYKPPLISEEDRASISIMPLPAEMELKSGETIISSGILTRYIGEQKVVEKAIERFYTQMGQRIGVKLESNEGLPLIIECERNDIYTLPSLHDDESYTLETGNEIVLKAVTPIGVMRGLETLKQLIQVRGETVILQNSVIRDKPRFPWRGIMVDVSRHWTSKDVILRILDAMATAKMNVFHWHLSDDQGFRVESKVFPKLHEIGSNGYYYTQKDIREVVQFAADRGIRVVPEFDVPGHTKSWQIAYPELSTVNYKQGFGTKKGQLFTPALDVTKEGVYDFMDAFIEEMAELFPDKYFHIGGDEVNPTSWNESSSVKAFMKEQNLIDGHELQAYFNSRIYQLVKKHGKTMLGWNEIFHPDLAEDVVIQAWTSHKGLFEAVQNGGSGILSTGLYLDLIQPAEKHYAIDPLVLAGAVNIEPDTTHWKRYKQEVSIGGNIMESELILFDKDPQNIYGFTGVVGQRYVFTDGQISNNKLTLSFEGPVGKMDYESTIDGGEFQGKMSIGLVSLDISGELIGSSEMPGTELPKIEVMRPLTEEEENRILGGEACQWAEFVDGDNIESRLWPRAAAISEKLWSPKELTNDVEDLYRRLETFSHQLAREGSQHDLSYQTKLQSMIPEEGLKILMEITDFCQEIEGHGRMGELLILENLYLPDFKLDRIVDAIKPESLPARKFNKLVKSFVEDQDKTISQEIIAQLEKWKSNHEKLSPFFSEYPKLKDIANLSAKLSSVSSQVIDKLNGENISNETLQKDIEFLKNGENGVVLTVADGLSELVQ